MKKWHEKVYLGLPSFGWRVGSLTWLSVRLFLGKVVTAFLHLKTVYLPLWKGSPLYLNSSESSDTIILIRALVNFSSDNLPIIHLWNVYRSQMLFQRSCHVFFFRKKNPLCFIWQVFQHQKFWRDCDQKYSRYSN